MAVLARQLTRSASNQSTPIVPVITTFADTFNRASGGLGANWLLGWATNAQATTPMAYLPGFANAQIDTITGGIQGLACIQDDATGGAMGLAISIFGVALQLAAVMVNVDVNNNGVAQFAEMELVSIASAGSQMRAGPSVFINSNMGGGAALAGGSYYTFVSHSENLLADLASFNQGTYAGIGGVTNIPVVLGDVLRIEVTPSPASNFLEVKVNGVSKGTATDSAANRPRYGIPGFINASFAGHLGLSRIELIDFNGGVL